MIAMRIFRVILFFIIPICFVTDLIALSVPDSILTLPEFRSIKWGSSLKNVQEQETAHYLQTFSGFDIEALTYKGNIAGLDARIDYTFRKEKLSEGSYTVISKDNFREDLLKLLSFLGENYGKPGYGSGPLYTSDSVWIKLNDYGKYIGPAFYWEFRDGFIGLISQKFKEEVTLTILFVSDLTIEEYNSNNFVDLKNFKIIKLNK